MLLVTQRGADSPHTYFDCTATRCRGIARHATFFELTRASGAQYLSLLYHRALYRVSIKQAIIFQLCFLIACGLMVAKHVVRCKFTFHGDSETHPRAARIRAIGSRFCELQCLTDLGAGLLGRYPGRKQNLFVNHILLQCVDRDTGCCDCRIPPTEHPQTRVAAPQRRTLAHNSMACLITSED